MTDEQRREKQPLSMTRRYRRGLILTGVLCVLAMLAAATVLFQRSYTDRVDDYLAQLGSSYAAAYKAQPTHDAKTLVSLLPKPGVDAPRFTLIGGDGTVLFDSQTSALVYDAANTVYAVMDSHLPSHADRPEFQQAMATAPPASPVRVRLCAGRPTTTPCASTRPTVRRCCAWARILPTSGA